MSDLNPHMDAGASGCWRSRSTAGRSALDRRERSATPCLAAVSCVAAVSWRCSSTRSALSRPRLAAAFVVALGGRRRGSSSGATRATAADADRLRPDAAAPADAARAAARRRPHRARPRRRRCAAGRPRPQRARDHGRMVQRSGPASCWSRSTPGFRRSRTGRSTGSPSGPRSSATALVSTALELIAGRAARAMVRDLRMVYRVDVLLFPSACSRRSPPSTSRPPRCSCCRSPTCCCRSRASARRACASRSSSGAPTRHRAAAARPARGGRRVHRPPHGGRRRPHGLRRRADGPRRGPAPLGRARGAAPRHRQDRRARRDHQQARPAQRRGVGDHEDPHRRGRAEARPRSAACSPTSASSCAPRTSAGTAAATRTAWRARRSRSRPASSPPATPSTR